MTDEAALIAAAQGGDPAARAEVVERFLPLLEAAARTYRPSAVVTHAELVQEGVVGLLRALERFDPARGVPFWAYASWWVRQAMQQTVSELTGPMVLSDRALRALSRVKDAHRALVGEHGAEPTFEVLAQHAGMEVDRVADLLAVSRVPRSLDEPVAGEEGQIGAFGELIADPLAEDAYERVLDAIVSEDLGRVLRLLTERELKIVAGRFGFAGDERPLRELGAELGLSAERVRQLERRAIAKMSADLGA
jgi:RNA polymerase sigma factor (sigma-70 family)